MTPSGSWILNELLFTFGTLLDQLQELGIAFKSGSLALEAAWPDSGCVSLEGMHSIEAKHVLSRAQHATFPIT